MDEQEMTAEQLSEEIRLCNSAIKNIKADADKKINLISERKKILDEQALALCKKIGCSSIKTKSGTIVRSIKQRHIVNDKHSFNKFVLENGEIGLLQTRVHESNMKTFLEENPDKFPPGVDILKEFVVAVRKPS